MPVTISSRKGMQTVPIETGFFLARLISGKLAIFELYQHEQWGLAARCPITACHNTAVLDMRVEWLGKIEEYSC